MFLDKTGKTKLSQMMWREDLPLTSGVLLKATLSVVCMHQAKLRLLFLLTSKGDFLSSTSVCKMKCLKCKLFGG